MDDTFDIDFGTAKQDRAGILARGMAEKIRDHIQAMGWTRKRQARWEKAFELLINQHGEEVVVTRVNKYIQLKIERPKVQSGDDFRNNWDWIGEEIERAVLLDGKQAELSQEERDVLEMTQELTWLVNTEKQLRGVVCRSVQNLKSFKSKLATSTDPKVKDAYRELVVYLDVAGYLTDFFKSVHRKYGRWAEWSGDLVPHTWTPTHDLASSYLKGILIRWAGEDDGSWNRVLEEVK